MNPEHTPLTDAELDEVDECDEYDGHDYLRMIRRLIAEVREARRLLRTVEDHVAEGSSELIITLEDIGRYLAACEGTKHDK